MPEATASGIAAAISVTAAPAANTAPIADAPVISPRLRDRFSMPETTPRCSAATSAIIAVLFAVWNSAYPAVTTASGTT